MRSGQAVRVRPKKGIFDQSLAELIATAGAFFKSSDWAHAKETNRIMNHELELPSAISPEKIRSFAQVVVDIGENRRGVVAASNHIALEFAEGEAFNSALVGGVESIRTNIEALAKLLHNPTRQQLSFFGRVEPVREALQVLAEAADYAEQVLQYSLIKDLGFGKNGVIKPDKGLGLHDPGLIITAWIARFKADPNCKLTCFCLACAWNLVKVKRCRGGGDDTFNWNSFAKRYRDWEAHPYANSFQTFVIEETGKNKSGMSVAGR